MLDCITENIILRKLVQIVVKAPQFYPKTVLNPPVNSKIQGIFKAFECFSSTFQNKFHFQGIFKTVLYIQVLFKPVQP